MTDAELRERLSTALLVFYKAQPVPHMRPERQNEATESDVYFRVNTAVDALVPVVSELLREAEQRGQNYTELPPSGNLLSNGLGAPAADEAGRESPEGEKR